MKCKDVQKLLSAYQDGRLTRDENIPLKDHLSWCPACQKEERALSDIWSMLTTLKPIEPSPDFRARFWGKVHDEETLQKSPWKQFIRQWREHFYIARPAFALASLVLVTLLGTLVALKLMPQGSVHVQHKSPIIQWAESAPQDLRSGGFSL